MSTGKAKQVLEAVMKAVEQDGECVFKLNEVDALIQKESVVDGKEAKKEEIVMKMASLVNVENMTVQQEMATHLEKMNVQHEKKMADLRKKLNDELSEDIECLIVQHVKKMADLRQKLNDEHEELSLERKKSVIGVMKLKPFGGGKQGRMMKGWQRDIYDALKNEGTIDGNGDYVLKAEAKKEEEVKKAEFDSQIEACSKVWDDGTIEIDAFELLKMVKKDDQDKREKDLMRQLGLVSDGKKVMKDCVYIKLVGESYYKTVIELGTYDEVKLFDMYELIVPLKTKEFPHSVTFGGLKSVQHAVWGARHNDLASLIYGGDLCGDIIVLDGDDEEEDAGSVAKMEVIAEGLKKYLEMKRNGN